MMMNPNILNQNPLMFFDRAVNAQRSQLLTVMADAVSAVSYTHLDVYKRQPLHSTDDSDTDPPSDRDS